MVNYENSKIYKLVNDVNGSIYVGSTVNPLWQRKSVHCNKSKDLTRNSKLYQLMRSIGVEHFKIILIENFKCKSKNELCAREQYYIDELKPSLNTYGAFLDNEVRKIKKNELDRIYRENNKEILKAQDQIIIHCDACDCDIRKRKVSRHNKSAKHITNLANKE